MSFQVVSGLIIGENSSLFLERGGFRRPPLHPGIYRVQLVQVCLFCAGSTVRVWREKTPFDGERRREDFWSIIACHTEFIGSNPARRTLGKRGNLRFWHKAMRYAMPASNYSGYSASHIFKGGPEIGPWWDPNVGSSKWSHYDLWYSVFIAI